MMKIPKMEKTLGPPKQKRPSSRGSKSKSTKYLVLKKTKMPLCRFWPIRRIQKRKIRKHRAQEESVTIPVDKVIVDGNIGAVHFKQKPPHYIVPGQLIVFSNFNHGGSKRDLKHLNGHWPVSAGDGKKSRSGKNVFYITGVKENPAYLIIEFDTLGLSTSTYSGDNRGKNVAMAEIRKTKHSVAYELMLRKTEHRVPWSKISKIIYDVTIEAREEVRNKTNVDTNVSVDWRSTENFMALYNNYIGRFLQYVSIAMANGPLAYESTPEVQSNGNGTETSSSLASEDDRQCFPICKLLRIYHK